MQWTTHTHTHSKSPTKLGLLIFIIRNAIHLHKYEEYQWINVFRGKHEKKFSLYCTLLMWGGTWGECSIEKILHSPHVGGYVRRVQYYPCECSKRLYTLYTSKILIFLVFFFARKLIFLHAKVVINYLKAKSCTKTGLTAKNRGKIIQ